MRGLAPLAKAERHALVGDAAVARGLGQRVGERLGRDQHVVEQSELAQFAVAREAEAEQVVAERFGRKLEKPDLALHGNARLAVVDLRKR